MNSDTRKLLEAVQQGAMSVDEALLAIKKEPFADIGYAKVDMHRGIRQGAAEVIYGAGKTAAQMIAMMPGAASSATCRSLTASAASWWPPAAPATSPWPRRPP